LLVEFLILSQALQSVSVWSRIIMAIVGSGAMVFFLTAFYNDVIDEPRVNLRDVVLSQSPTNMTLSFVVTNQGATAAHNARLSVTTEDVIVGHALVYTQEEMTLERISPTMIIGKLSRLTEGAEFKVSATVNSTSPNSLFTVSLAFDEGSWQYDYSVTRALQAAQQGINWNNIALVVSIAIVIVSFSSILRPKQFGMLRTDKQRYVSGETIMISGKVKRVSPESSVLIRVINPKGALSRTDSWFIADNATFEYPFASGGPLMQEPGIYTVTATYKGATASTSFRFS
jgi:hypothetical protein